jgi:flagellar motility protein MotE (MotC chaperone)
VSRLRLLPIAIFGAVALLTFKLGSVWQGVELAVAQAADPPKPAPGPRAPEESRAKPERLGDGGGAFTEAELNVLQKLAARREELDQRERDMEMRQTLLEATEKRLDGKLAELKKIQETVDDLLRKHDKEQDAKLGSLVKIYENMKPKDAAQVFDKLELPILLDMTERMREQKSAAIIARMETDKAKELTAALAVRRKLPKTVP